MSVRITFLSYLLTSTVLLNTACVMKNPTTFTQLAPVMEALAQKHETKSTPLREYAFQQAWLEALEPNFAPALTRIYAEADGLVVLAVLENGQIYNSADSFNQKTWRTGDVFEIFTQVSPDLYYEFHVTPENQNLFLRWNPALLQAVRQGEA